MQARVVSYEDRSQRRPDGTLFYYRVYNVTIIGIADGEDPSGRIREINGRFSVPTTMRSEKRARKMTVPTTVAKDSVVNVKSYQHRSFDVGASVKLVGLTARIHQHNHVDFMALVIEPW